MINQTLKGFIRKELTQSLRDPKMRFFLFVVPVIQLTLFGYALSTEVKNIRLAAHFDTKDSVLRDIYERSIQSKWFIPAKTSLTDPAEIIRRGQADAVLVPPPGGFTSTLGHGDAHLQLLINATNATQAAAVESYLTAITSQVVKDDLGSTQAKLPIQFNIRVLYNPSLDTSIFMVPGVLCTLMVMASLTLCMGAMTREKETGTFEMLISAPVSTSEIIFGKTIPYVLLGMCNFPFTLAVAVFVFGVPLRGSLILLMTAALFFVCTAVAIGALLSSLCKNQQQANLASFLFMFPAIMFSGLMFPTENIPKALKFLAYIDPLSHYLSILRNIMLKGGDLQFVWTHIAFLTVIGVIAAFFSFRRFATTLQ